MTWSARLVPMPYTDTLRAASLTAQIDAHPELWNTRPERRDAPGSAHAAMSDIWLRYNDPARLHDPASFNDEHYPVWYPAWGVLTEAHAIVWDMMAAVRGEALGGILITRIPPGGRIEPHADASWHVGYFNAKLYLSLRSAPGAVFHLENEAFSPRPGEIWRIDNRHTHWVANNSEADRMTLIVCIRSHLFDGYDVGT